MSFPMCIGHRGAKGHVAENTLPSFEYAISLGCDWIELDVHLVEGELIVFHDRKLERTTNGTGLITDHDLSYLRSLDAGNGAQIPLLSEVIDLVDGRCGINVELKAKHTAGPVSRQLAEYCRGHGSPDQFLVSSFDHRELAQVDPMFRRGALFAKRLPDEWQRAAALGAWSVNFDLTFVTGPLVDEAHERGYQVLVYTANTVPELEALVTMNVDGIFTDFPDRLINLRTQANPA